MKKKTLIVIGGSRGIGAATAILGAEKGYCVAIGYYRRQNAAEAIVHIINDKGGNASCFQIDVSDFASVECFFDQVVNIYGIPDAVAHCAGVTGPHGTLISLENHEIVELLATNLTGTFLCVQLAAKIMAISNGGHGGSIVTLSSEAGTFGGNKISPYAASKAGINAMTKGVARELAAENIRLNSVSPGVIDTEQQGILSEDRKAALLSSIPMGRMGDPDEVAKTILWLLSDEASYISGAVISVSGGR